MQLDEPMLQQITVDVCQSMLGLELNPMNTDNDSTLQQLVAAVEIRGSRCTIVEVFADDQLMGRIAEAMFASDSRNLTEEEIRDAFCEIANMIGGNVKGNLGEDADLSLPMFGTASNWLEQLPQGSLRTTFDCCGLPLSIVLREVHKKDEPLSVA